MSTSTKKVVRAWMYKGDFNLSIRAMSHKAKQQLGISDDFFSTEITFKKPTNPDFVQVTITYIPLTKTYKKK